MEMLFLMKTINRIYLLLASALSVAVVMGIDSASPSVEGVLPLDDANEARYQTLLHRSLPMT